jgi:hypothetical protein
MEKCSLIRVIEPRIDEIDGRHMTKIVTLSAGIGSVSALSSLFVSEIALHKQLLPIF